VGPQQMQPKNLEKYHVWFNFDTICVSMFLLNLDHRFQITKGLLFLDLLSCTGRGYLQYGSIEVGEAKYKKSYDC
jgi:hypothetical protein